MDSNLAEVFDINRITNKTNPTTSKESEEKSTIDKVFEDLDKEVESSVDTQTTLLNTESNFPSECNGVVDRIERVIRNTEPKVVSGDIIGLKNDTTRGNDILDQPFQNKNNYEGTNLMLHIDIAKQNESIKSKDGIELADLLEVIKEQPSDIKAKLPEPNSLLDMHDNLLVSEVNVCREPEPKRLVLAENDGLQIASAQFEIGGVTHHNLNPLQNVPANFSFNKQDEIAMNQSSSTLRNPNMDDAIRNPLFGSSQKLDYQLESLDSADGRRYTAYDDGLMEEPLQHHLNDDYSLSSTVNETDFLAKYKQMEAQQEMLNRSLISLSSHFAQVQLRLKQIINSPKQEQEALLKNLEKFTFIGIPEVNELCLYNYTDATSNVHEDASERDECKTYIEDKLAFEKNKHKEMIGKLKNQLEALENYVYEFSNNDDSEIPTNQIINKQQIIINELKDKLNLNVNLSEEEQLREEINKSIISPMKTKEDLILQLKTQISDLEKFINFLQSTQCKCAVEAGQVDMKNKTITIMKKISTILHIFAEHHSSNFKKPTATMKKSMKGNHYGDLRAQLEIAINHVIDVCRQPPDQDLPIDSDYMSDTDDVVPCNSKVALAVRKHLAPTLQRLLQHGLSSPNGNQTLSVVQYISCASSVAKHHHSAHIWDLISKYYEIKDGPDFNCKPNRKLSESFNLEIGNGNLGIKQSLLASIGNILSIHHKYKKYNPDSYFKSFVCDGLNKKLLVEWLQVILTYKTLSAEFYTPWSYVATTKFADAAQSLRRLYEFHFSLTIVDVTIRNLQSIKDAF
ncbi:RUN domain-containing protein 1 [Diaphorina citri]|uniref:RUN domain-containing protein 1 n=1 Tax=Diaphorina citri TaxID=121845 RepID=A0A1S3CVY1_DIACI|nr:RUN domain-containing protein 1 [Diaphorina citri]